MMFTSIDPADIPYRAGQRVKVLRQEPGFTLVMRDLRPAHTVNPILAKYRQSDERTQWHMRQGSWISWPTPPYPDGAADHARKVFARLANLERGAK